MSDKETSKLHQKEKKIKVQIFELESLSSNLESPYIFYIIYRVGKNFVYFCAGSETEQDLHHVDLHSSAQEESYYGDELLDEPIAGGVLTRMNNQIEYFRESNLYGNNEDLDAHRIFLERIQRKFN